MGLVGDALPSMAFNTLDGRLYPHPTHERITEPGIKAFTEDFLSGRVRPQRASQTRREAEQAAAAAARDGADGLLEITFDTFNDICLDTSHDVLVLYYSSAAQVSKDLWPYFRRVVQRFRALNITSLRIGRYDVSKNQLPNRLEIENFPAIIMYPANDKEPPFRLFHGKAQVRPIMLWAQETASIKFAFENDTPHLDAEQREAYIVQIKERNERVAEKRAEERKARAARLDKEAGKRSGKRSKSSSGSNSKDDL
uniref:Thioredoxin domain-containing protein n=1 Tax=Cryptomonas curvata TaxID=233186 RepID=A0A7S0QJA9_9CRYP